MAVPLVTVIIPIHNRLDLLRRALETAFAQEGLHTLFDLDVIVVDDASSLFSPDDVRRSLGPAPVTYVRHDVNRGVAVARNTGIRLARGEYVAFLDDDDEFLPHKLRLQLDVLQHDPRVGLVYGPCIARAPDGTEEVWSRGPSGWIFPALLRGQGFQVVTVLVRRAVLEACGGFDETMAETVLEDLELWLRIAHRFRVVCVHEPVGIYYRASGRFLRRLADGSALGDYLRLAEKVAAYEPRVADSGLRQMQTAWVNSLFHFLPEPQALQAALDAFSTHPDLARNPAVVQIVSVHVLQHALADASPVAYAARISASMPRALQGAVWAHLAFSLGKRRALPPALYAAARAVWADPVLAVRTAHTRVRPAQGRRAA